MNETELSEVVTTDLHAMAKAWLEARNAVAVAEEQSRLHGMELIACRQRVTEALVVVGAAAFAGVVPGDCPRAVLAILGKNGVVTVRLGGDGSSVPYTAAFVPFAV